jgi:cytochrome P450
LAGQPLGFAEFGQLPLLRRVLDEGLRLYPPAWVFIRQALGPDVLDGCEVRRGDNLVVSPYLMHRHPDYWTNPEAFDPDRFSPERGEPFHKFAYLPFGAGPRLCIGLQFAQAEMVIVLARLLQHYTVRTAPTTRGEMNPLITLKPLHGMDLVFERVR